MQHKQDYTGPLYEQIESAYAFVLRNIQRSAKVEGLILRGNYELPTIAIREMIINAHCHRNFLDEGCVQVALYDDRLEVTSPGGLYNGLTLEEALSGRSRQRNRVIAEAFNQMGLIEAWGNGLKSIRKAAKAYDLPEPEFIEMPETFRVNLFRKVLPLSVQKVVGNAGINGGDMAANGDDMAVNVGDIKDAKTVMLQCIRRAPRITVAALAKNVSISQRTSERYLRELKESGRLVRHGTPRGGYWEIIDN